MGIRYYAYAFDGHATDQVLSDPLSVVSADPLADAWGLEPGASISHTNFEQVVSERDMLYLDKAWRYLQFLTSSSKAGETVRPAFRMFEGSVTMNHEGWEPWVRALTPSEVVVIARDLVEVSDDEVHHLLSNLPHVDRESGVKYAVAYLQRARAFVTNLAEEGRGMVYIIG